VSLGKTNFCLQALMEKGWIKVQNFKNNKNKLAYTYLLTPSGIEEKAKLTVQYLRIKMQEYELLRREIHELSKEVEDSALIIN
jgi:EPS-associated MarR family transcriptional regulator